MQTLIICFSQTGHTRTVAGCIRDGIVAVTGQCDLTEIKAVDGKSLDAYDLVGLGCPVFYYQEPANVRDFIGALQPLNGQQWFVFCTHGSIIGTTIASMSKQLEEKGARITGFHDTYADATLPFYPHPTYTTGHPDALDLEQATFFGRRIAERGQKIAGGGRVQIPAPPALPDEWIKNAEMFSLEYMAKIFPRLTINPEKCTLCLACEKDCPVEGIEILTNPQRIQNPCIFCWNCVNVCPAAAIEADWSRHISLVPKLYARYRYWLDKAASQDEFRWLINPDDIDFNNPYVFQEKRKK